MTIERIVRLVAGTFVVLSVVLCTYVSRGFCVFTAFVGANLFQSAFTNWCPLMTVLRKVGFKAECESCA